MHQISGDGYGKVLVFANTKRFVDSLTMALRRNGWRAVGIHGDKSQLQRDTIISKFKSGDAKILVATDVAARGLGKFYYVNYKFNLSLIYKTSIFLGQKCPYIRGHFDSCRPSVILLQLYR